ncbi:MAG: hypothetical protein JXA21_16510 [Anaerolineae bacterium]|nr:hypothetical protein [Anaerolineae bacterium]
MKQVQGEEYKVTYDEAQVLVVFQGMMRLQGASEYAHIEELLNEVLSATSEAITLDLRELEFLNSSGINAILKFAFKVRDLPGRPSLILQAKSSVPWQSRMLSNMQRLLSGVKVQYS